MKFEMNLKIEKPRYFTVSDITYAQVDAWFGHTTRDLKLDLIYPKLKNKKYPCIVWFCGGGWIRLDKSAHFAYLAKLALEGFAVASVEYRTSNEGAYPMPLEDVKAAIRYIKAHADRYNIDENKIGVAGESAGAAEVWHPDVRFFTIDDGNGNRLGSFYLDLFSRSNKRAGAWMNTLDTGSPSTPETPGKPRLGMVCLNIHPPAAGDTVILSHREVRTLFHEFGHLLHLMFTRVSIPSLAGTSVPRDFVEVPSQFMENWCWRPDVLKSFARHERTGLPIPEEMLNALDASRGNTPALALAGQLLYAKMDLAVHSEPERFSAGSLDDVDSAVAGDMDYFKDFKRAGKLRTARHLFSSPAGYASFYFSYQWAEVLDKDIFEAFERAGGPDRETAGKFRKTILEKGYAVPPMRQFMDFMGRKPRMDAMLRKRRLAS